MGIYGFMSVGVGAVFGAWLRWWLAVLLNPILPALPLGTLVANLLGGYLMGLTLGYFEHFQTLALETRLLIATGFLGSLTTFSTFSAETTALLLRHEYGWASLIIGSHVVGSLLMTVLGIGTMALIKGWIGTAP
jgi:fluoride exporter